MSFHEIVDAADQLSLDEQRTLFEILRKRIAEAKRQQLVQDVEEARQHFAKGECEAASPEDTMKEILS